MIGADARPVRGPRRPTAAGVLAVLLAGIGGACADAGSPTAPADALPDASEPVESVESVEPVAQVVEAACGQCRFGLTGGECDLAVRIDGVARFVTGTAIDDHGDAHAEDGFCNAIRRARVVGRVEGDRFAVSTFELLPAGG